MLLHDNAHLHLKIRTTIIKKTLIVVFKSTTFTHYCFLRVQRFSRSFDFKKRNALSICVTWHYLSVKLYNSYWMYVSILFQPLRFLNHPLNFLNKFCSLEEGVYWGAILLLLWCLERLTIFAHYVADHLLRKLYNEF